MTTNDNHANKDKWTKNKNINDNYNDNYDEKLIKIFQMIYYCTDDDWE